MDVYYKNKQYDIPAIMTQTEFDALTDEEKAVSGLVLIIDAESNSSGGVQYIKHTRSDGGIWYIEKYSDGRIKEIFVNTFTLPAGSSDYESTSTSYWLPIPNGETDHPSYISDSELGYFILPIPLKQLIGEQFNIIYQRESSTIDKNIIVTSKILSDNAIGAPSSMYGTNATGAFILSHSIKRTYSQATTVGYQIVVDGYWKEPQWKEEAT